MEGLNLNQRDNNNVLVDHRCSPQRSHLLSISSQRHSNSDVDFNDVFGGPPRRSSIHEMRYSLNESSPDRCKGSFDMPVHRNPWTGLSEKPVFGGDNTSRRRYVSEDFYDDIYKGNESACSSPRKNESDPFSSVPGSRVLSPAKPLPPRASPFGSPSVQFSLPAKLSQPMDLPAFGSSTNYSYEHKDGGVNGAIGSHTPKVSISGFLSPKAQVQEDYVKLPRLSYRPSPLSHEFSLGSESPDLVEPQKLDNQKKDSDNFPDSTSNAPFHFSIYKWASKGIPLTMPLRRASSSKGRDKERTERLSSKEKIEHQSKAQEPTTSAAHDDYGSPFFHNKEMDDGFCETDNLKPESGLTNDSLQVEDRDSQAVEEEFIPKDKTDVLEGKESCTSSDETKPRAPVKEIDNKTEQSEKPEMKPLQSFLGNKEDGIGCDEDGITKKTGGRSRKQKGTKHSSVHAVATKDEKKQDGESRSLIDKKETKDSPRRSPVNLQDNMGKNRGKGKVKEFIRIFNQDAPSKPESRIHPQRQSSRRNDPGISKTDDEAANMTGGIYANGNTFPGENLKATKAIYSLNLNVDEIHKQPEKRSSSANTSSLFSDSSSGQNISSAPSTESAPENAKVKVEEAGGSFHGNFVIKELSEDENKQREYQEEIRVIDAKIRKWSNGKEGNIRSLLSTLQYVLWPGSGWKPIPLVDIIEGPAVKRAYQRALLYLHPDKLQQKGAASHQKYTAQQVFDILQEAWDHFNSLGSL